MWVDVHTSDPSQAVEDRDIQLDRYVIGVFLFTRVFLMSAF
jgi:hypothetical protein